MYLELFECVENGCLNAERMLEIIGKKKRIMNIEYGDLILIWTIHHIRNHLNIDWNMKKIDWKFMKTTNHNKLAIRLFISNQF